MDRSRRLLFTYMPVALLGCAVGQAPYAPPADIPLQDAPPGQAVVYLIRIPYDNVTVRAEIDGAERALLPPNTYTAVVVQPGEVRIRTSRMDGTKALPALAPDLVFDIKPDQRIMLYLSGSADSGPNQAAVSILGGKPTLTVPASRRTVTSGWEWKIASDVDAQGLMSIAKAVLPVQ